VKKKNEIAIAIAPAAPHRFTIWAKK